MEQLQRIRGMWQFANLCQWIYIFGDAATIDDAVDVDYIETECLKPNSPGLNDIALALLRLVSSQRGLTHASFDDQARKQFLLRSPDTNPFGDEGAPKSFAELDVFSKIRVMQQFTQWAMIRPELLREKMKEQKDTEQTTWRIEPYGWDSEDRTYYVLDDNRVYRLSEAPPSHRPASSKLSRQSRRTGKRRRVTEPDDAANLSLNDAPKEGLELEYEDTHLGDMVWECVAVTLPEVQALVESMAKSRDENEKILRKQLRDHLLPILEKQEQERSRRELRREKELATLAKMANAKRSSRIASKAEQREQQEKERIEQERLREEAAIQRREEQKRVKIQRELEMRLVSREQRLKQREERRVRRGESGSPASVGEGGEVTVADVVPGQSRPENGENDRHLQGKQEEEEAWVFDCPCGLYGQVDDGHHSVACESCNVWQHSRCLGISEAAADHPDFHFICASCRQKNPPDTAPRSKSPAVPKSPAATMESHPAPESNPAPKSPAAAPESHPVTENPPATESSPAPKLDVADHAETATAPIQMG